jgi:hypothetical protein
MNVYELSPILDDPRFDEFDFDDRPSLLKNDYLYQDFKGEHWMDRAKLSWEPFPLSNLWTPQRVVGSVGEYVDYTRASSVPVFSLRATKVLHDLLEPNGELLEILPKRSKTRYFAYNIMKKSDALDLARSQVTFLPETGIETARRISYFAFNEEKLQSSAIFRIREYPVISLVTETFKQRVEQAGLNGFYFIKVYPFPEGESWEQVELARSRARKGKTEALRGNCLIVHLTISGRKATEEEEEQGMQVAHRIAEHLTEMQTSLNGDFVGAVDSLDTGKKELLIILATGDADNLAKVLTPLFAEIDWPHSVSFEKVYGDRFDKKTKRETVSL